MVNENKFERLIGALEELAYGDASDEIITALINLGTGGAKTKLGGMELIAKEIRDGFQTLHSRLSDINERLIEMQEGKTK